MECQITGCRRTATVRLDLGGYCRNHYIRERNKGRIPKLVRPSKLERFRGHYVVDKATGCHIWQGNKANGYGQFKVSRYVTRVAHRWLWQEVNGPLDPAIHLDHFHCDNRACVNLDHVRPTSPRENALRADSPTSANAAKVKCLRGHPFDEENTYVTPDGKRQCRTCKRDECARRRANRAAA